MVTLSKPCGLWALKTLRPACPSGVRGTGVRRPAGEKGASQPELDSSALGQSPPQGLAPPNRHRAVSLVLLPSPSSHGEAPEVAQWVTCHRTPWPTVWSLMVPSRLLQHQQPIDQGRRERPGTPRAQLAVQLSSGGEWGFPQSHTRGCCG